MFQLPSQGQQSPSTFIPADQFSPAHLIHHPDADPDVSEAPNHCDFLAVESHSPERQRIGGLLYQQVSKLNPDIPGKITGVCHAESCHGNAAVKQTQHCLYITLCGYTLPCSNLQYALMQHATTLSVPQLTRDVTLHSRACCELLF